MNQTLVNWVIERLEEQMTDSHARHIFLRDLKFRRYHMQQFLGHIIDHWAIIYYFETRKLICVNFSDNPNPLELLEALQQHFAKELEEIHE